jgi:hypothetical protein
MTHAAPNCDESSRLWAGKPTWRALLYRFDDGEEQFVQFTAWRGTVSIAAGGS